MAIFRGGVPIEPDVRKLFDHFKTPAENSLIAYADIERIIGAKHGTSRFQGVVSVWRKQLERPPHCRRMVAQSDQRAYMVLDGDGHAKHADRKIDLGIRGVKRQVVSLVNIDASRLTTEGKLVRDHALLKGGTVTAYQLRMSKRSAPQLSDTNVSR